MFDERTEIAFDLVRIQGEINITEQPASQLFVQFHFDVKHKTYGSKCIINEKNKQNKTNM